ncbi:MAG: beta-ribofuranosylaminobenzene 5'-phosphate synthase [Candidatus Aminicenantes bacterium]|jgi:beta-ribofuranosylaminobenzene 5'-phosphate synthase
MQAQNSIKKIIVTAFPRMHITLIGMNRGGYRINGGVGFAIEKPNLSIQVNPSKTFGFRDMRTQMLHSSEIERLSSVVERIKSKFKFTTSIDVLLSGDMLTHYGFGSGTAIRLACLESLFLMNKFKIDINLLVQLSGRGGTSGIGINTYFKGGFIFDIGHENKGKTSQSSSFSEYRKRPALLLKHLAMPLWDIGICIPSKVKPKSEMEEKLFFESTCPISDNQIYETLYHALYGIHAAILEKNKHTFCKSLINIQMCAWKKSEKMQYGNDLVELENDLYKCGASAVGMSSLGPTLLFLSDNVFEVIKKMLLKNAPCQLIHTQPMNKGRIVDYG